MRKTSIQRFLSICIIIIATMIFTIAPDAVTSIDIQDKKNQREQYEQMIKDLEKKRTDLKKLAANAKAYIQQMDEEIARYSEMLDEINRQIDEKNAAIEQNRKKLEQAQIDREKQYADMKLRIKYMYEKGSQGYVEVILSASSLGELLNKSEYVSKIAEYDRGMLDKLLETENLIARTAQQLEADLAELEDLRFGAEQSKTAAELLRVDKQSQLAANEKSQNQLANEIQEGENSLAALDKEIEEMERLLEAQNSNGSLSYNGGRFKWPTKSTRITTYFGQGAYGSFRPGAFHSGMDIGAVRPGVAGDEIWAAYDGVVTVSAYNWSGGEWVWLQHGNGMYTIYMHMSRRVAQVGQTLKKGDLVGYMGTTGDSSGVHLHFSVRLNGAYTDPMPYFNK